MRKTISITVSNQLFHIEEQGFQKLDAYLNTIRAHFASYEDRDEIVADIEARIAEHFQEKLSKAKNVISEEDVDELIKNMGTVKDFEAFEGESHDAKDEPIFKTNKRLYRNANDQMIAGVCAGIANFFDIDPTIVRLLFVASLFLGGAGILVYIVLWIVLPEAKTTSEKVEMRGQKLTLKRIEATIRESIPAAKDKIPTGTLQKIIRFPFVMIGQVLRFVGRIIRVIVPWLVRVIGLAMLIGVIIGTFILTCIFIMLLTGAWDVYMDVPIRQLAEDTTYYTGLISSYLALLLPAMLIIVLATSMMLMRNLFRAPFVISVIGIWIAVLLVGCVTIAREAPVLSEKIDQYVETHDAAVTKELTVEPFRSVEVHGGYEVHIVKGDTLSTHIVGSQRATDALRMKVEEGTLTISREQRDHFCFLVCLSNSADITITVPDSLDNLAAFGGASIDAKGVDITGHIIESHGGATITMTDATLGPSINATANGGAHISLAPMNALQQLNLEVNGGSWLTFNGTAQNVIAAMHGGGGAELRGSGTTLSAEIVGGASLHAENFTVQDATIDANGGGDAMVHVTDTLKGSAHGGGSIYYKGEPQTIEVEQDPSGRVQSFNEEENW